MTVAVLVDTVEVVITILHKITQSKRSIMGKDMIKKKISVKIIFKTLKVLVIGMVPKDTSLESVKHRGTLLRFKRHL